MTAMVEPWLRGTLTELDPLRSGVVHALWLAAEDVERWCVGLSEQELGSRPLDLPPIGFQMRHMVRSLDRLLTYAEGRQLSDKQMTALRTELDTGIVAEMLIAEVGRGLKQAEERVRRILPDSYEELREVGRKMLPTTVGGLLVHCADHTQRHAGQMVTTAKVVIAMRV